MMEAPAMIDNAPNLILIVTGSSLRAEQMDRPLAYYLQSQIDKLNESEQDTWQSLVLSDRYYLSRPDLHELPLISVGGPGVNQLAQKLLTKLPALFAADDAFFIQMNPESDVMQASIWGFDSAQTQTAVLTFAERYLSLFTEVCRHGPSCK
jgi:hypothetical protein